MPLIHEGKATITYYEGKISKKLPVFYNPIMKLNRDISILLLNTIEKTQLQIGLPLAGTGIRGIRFLLELQQGKIKYIHFNDINPQAVQAIKENLARNIPQNSENIEREEREKGNREIKVTQEDASLVLLQSNGFDYIDIDPFGDPCPFLDAAMVRIARKGIVAVTATDTGALCGTFPLACQRKYWSKPLHNEQMHEFGLRILIRRVQLVAASYEKALTPIFSYAKDHYMRVFFSVEKGRQKVDVILAQHGPVDEGGPFWLGQLWDDALLKKMITLPLEENIRDWLSILQKESDVKTVGFYELPVLAKKFKKQLIKKKELIQRIEAKGYKAAPTHFSGQGIRSTIPLKELVELLP
ncbi:hypothetical protein HYW21_09105 [Candidatus Woesearchaeota archaeon]|nr:hypothetical protein [Candidatus Woesearchaeota archaeon]